VDVTVGTFNLNNLFSRFNFQGEIEAIRDSDTSVDSKLEYKFGAGDTYKIRGYEGRLVKGKKPEEISQISERIKSMNVDVLAIQEVEDVDTLRQFNKEYLSGMYPYQVLVEGNDQRLIDIGLPSKLPIGSITSWQRAVHPDDTTRPIFSRDLLQIEIFNRTRSEKLFTLFNNHLKSPLLSYKDDPVTAKQQNDDRRTRQAEMVARIVKAQTRPDSPLIVLGDMNDAADSLCLSAFTKDEELRLTNALASPRETRPAPSDTPPPLSSSWTHRYKPSKKPAEYALYDQIWLSSGLADGLTGAWIDRRTKLTGNGSDHDPAWVALSL
jgi:endonuclease/exonuclease/phosphatase family metal-dependent hydrolase